MRSMPPVFDFVAAQTSPPLTTFMHHLARVRNRHRWSIGREGDIRAAHQTGIGEHDPISAVAELLSPGLAFRSDDVREAAIELGLSWEQLCTLQASIDNNSNNPFFRDEVYREIRESLGL